MKKLVRPKPEIELDIYREFFVDLCRAKWIHDDLKDDFELNRLLKKVLDCSVARIYSTGNWYKDEQEMIRTLLNLKE